MTASPSDDDAQLDALLLQILDAEPAAQAQALERSCAAAPALAERLRLRWRVLAKFGLAAEAAEPVPARLGDYRIERRLGSGGMGVVYEACHLTLGRRVALKCIRPELLADARALARFRRETVALARLQHPGLCTLYESGEAGGQPFLAMQFVVGEALEQQLARARAEGHACWSQGPSGGRTTESGQAIVRGVREAIALVARLARAVEVMHQNGLVHRDLKPANVMVTPDGPVLIDLGLVRNLADAAPALTISSDVVGTPAYMAPEQVEPRGRAADARTDVHALGALLYECLTLRPPFLGAGREDTYRRILQEEPVDLRQLQPAAGRDLAAVVHRALAKEPRARFATAADFADELDRLQRGEPTRTRPPGAGRRLLAWARQRPTLVGSVATLFVALAIGLVITWGLLRQAERAKLTYESLQATEHDPALGLLLGGESLRLGGGEPARSACYEALAELRQVDSWPLSNTATAVAASADGAVVAAGLWTGGDIHLFGPNGARSCKATGRIRGIAIDGDRMLVFGHLPRAVLFDLDGEVVAPLFAEPPDVLAAVPVGEEARFPYGCLDGGLHGDSVFLISRAGRVRVFDRDGAPREAACWHAQAPAGGWTAAVRDPASGRVAFGGRDGTVALFGPDGVPMWTKRVHEGAVRFVQFAPDGQSLLAAPGQVALWQDKERLPHSTDFTATILRDGSVLRLDGHRDLLTSASFAPDGTRVLTTSRDGFGLLWQIDRPRADGTVPFAVLAHDKPVEGGLFFADGQRVLTRMENADPVQWDALGQRIGELRGHLGGCYAIAAVGAGERLLTSSLDKRLLLWDARSAWCDEWRLGEAVVDAFWADDAAVWVQTTAGLRRLRRGHAAPEVPSMDQVPAGVARRTTPGLRAVVASGDRLIVVPGDGGGAVFSWGEDGRRELLPAPDAANDPRLRIELASLAADARTGRVAFGGTNGDVLVLAGDGAFIARRDLKLAAEAVMGLGWLPDGSMLAAMRDGLLLRIDAAGVRQPLRKLNSYLVRMAVAADGRLAAIADGNRRVHVVDAHTGAALLTVPPMGGPIRTLSFARDGSRLLVATDNGDVRLWPLLLAATGPELVASSPYQRALDEAAARRGENR